MFPDATQQAHTHVAEHEPAGIVLVGGNGQHSAEAHSSRFRAPEWALLEGLTCAVWACSTEVQQLRVHTALCTVNRDLGVVGLEIAMHQTTAVQQDQCLQQTSSNLHVCHVTDDLGVCLTPV